MSKENFIKELMATGILAYKEQESLWQIVQRCAKTAGAPMAAGVGLASANAGAVVLPAVGSVPGYLVGALVGFATGTAACTALNTSHRAQLRALAKEIADADEKAGLYQ